MAEFRMPALGADMRDGTLVVWRRKLGETLKRGDVIAEVETDKGVIEVEVYAAGILDRYLVEPGQRVPVGTPLALLTDLPTGGEAAAPQANTAAPSALVVERSTGDAGRVRAPLSAAGDAGAATSAPPTAAAAVGVDAPPSLRRRARELGVDLRALTESQRPSVEAVEHAAADAAKREPASPVPREQRTRISPAARRLAHERGIDERTIQVTSPDGAIALADVERAVQARESAAHAPPASEQRQAALRRAIGSAMARSKREIPHYYLSETIDLGRATTWLTERNAERSVRDRVLISALLLKAVALAAKQLPDFNAWWQDDAPRPMPDVHLGVAIALRGGGLVAPAIHDAHALELGALMAKLQDLVERARSGMLRSSELSDGTITVTSLGERGVQSVLPIIYPPQTAIVGFGRVADRPWVIAGALAVRPLVTASLGADHRVTDGHLGARFLTLIDHLLQEPERL
jgi:pyruvate dehydrogenase E2 component (dihydrolipoamide acetyltransferase)